ncbi:MAG: hypothetical protein WC225_02990 [Acholeplasmataceae bacterium]|nr:hypothetical protein [Acholeplasmataceae bacterium]
MQILFIVLNDLSHLQTILETFIELEVRGATILDSEGMAKAVLQYEGLSYIFSGPFEKSLPKQADGSKTIFTVIPDSEKVPIVVQRIQDVLANSEKDVIGFMFTLPVSGVYPLKKRT